MATRKLEREEIMIRLQMFEEPVPGLIDAMIALAHYQGRDFTPYTAPEIIDTYREPALVVLRAALPAIRESLKED